MNVNPEMKRLMNSIAVVLASAACVVVPASAGAATGNERGATLSVQRDSASDAPRVRSVQRDAADNETVSAAANETVEVLLADGTSLTLSPGTRLVIERYRYDRASRLGELELRLEAGAMRVMGGVLNNSSAVVVRTPTGVVTLDNAVAYLSVTPEQTEVALVAGRGIQIAGAGQSRELTKAGTAVTLDSSGKFAGETRSLNREELQAYSNRVNPGLASGVVPTFVVDDGSPTTLADAENSGSLEDQTAKDDKLLPAQTDPTGAAGACSAGGCVAAAPNFDLPSAIGTIADRQAGRTAGATWLRQYLQGDAIAAGGDVRGYVPDYTTVGDGRRDTTGRIFGADAATPFSVTLGSGAPISADYYDDLFCRGGACQTSPIVNLYSGNDGVVYRVAGFGSFDYNFPQNLVASLQLHFNQPAFQMTRPDFDAHPIIVDIPFDFTQPGVIVTRSVTGTINGCALRIDQSCTQNFASYADMQAALNDLDLSDYSPQVGGSGLGLFSRYDGPTVVTTGTPTSGPYNLSVNFTGETAYDVTSLISGFELRSVRNVQSEFNEICFLGSPGCTALARTLFGAVGGDEFGEPRVTLDVDFPQGTFVYPETIAEVMVRGEDSFLAVDMSSRLPGDEQRLFYANGQVSGRLPSGAAAQGATLDNFRLSAGLNASLNPGRAFLRPQTLLTIAPSALLSSDLRVLNAPYSTNVVSPSRVLQYDFAATQSGNDRASTISVTLGTLTYTQSGPMSPGTAQLSGRTVGSSASSGTTRYSGSMQSAQLSTSAGGGNPNIANTGRAGYLVIENYDPASAPNGGLERTIESGAATQTNYATLRFGQILSGGSQAAPANRSSTVLTGYAAGLAEITSPTAGSVEIAALTSGNFQLTTNAAQGTVGATLSASVGTSSTNLTFGSNAGASGLSAYTGAKEFAAMTGSTPNLAAGAVADATAANAAIVSGAPLIGTTNAQGWTSDLDAATRAQMSTNAANTTGYRYLQWGFFFGDFSTAAGRSAHAHLTSWVAGQATPEGTPLPSGTAQYTGHVFANVSNGDQLYSATGTFANQWNFATRSGTGSMNFDGGNYTFITRLLGLQRTGTELTSSSTSRFEGLISNGTDPAYIGSMNGGFVADPAATDPLGLRSGVMGQFSLENTRNGNPYRAVGTFAGER